jgi:hypothetical protein
MSWEWHYVVPSKACFWCRYTLNLLIDKMCGHFAPCYVQMNLIPISFTWWCWIDLCKIMFSNGCKCVNAHYNQFPPFVGEAYLMKLQHACLQIVFNFQQSLQSLSMGCKQNTMNQHYYFRKGLHVILFKFYFSIWMNFITIFLAIFYNKCL